MKLTGDGLELAFLLNEFTRARHALRTHIRNALEPGYWGRGLWCDLSQPLGNLLFQEIHDALIEHQVIFFRDQE